jgi:ABC-type antimicrobial peptide transport system permease subunit
VSAVWLRARAQLRGRAQATVLLLVLVGVAGGVVLAAVAGARRSDAALPRFLAASQTTDATVWFLTGPRGGQPAQSELAQEMRTVAALPQVRAVERGSALIISVVDSAGPSPPRPQLAWVGLDRTGSELFNHPRLLTGRLPRPDRADEVAVDEEFANWRRLQVGASFRVGTYLRGQFRLVGRGDPIRPKGPAAGLRVTGILRSPDDLVPMGEGRDEPDTWESSQVVLTPAFWRRHGLDSANYGVFMAVDLHHGQRDLAAFTTAIDKRFRGQAVVDPASFTQEGNTAITDLRRAINLETAALLVFAALAGLSALLLAGQTLGRQMVLESVEYPILRALGMTRWQLVAVAMTRAAWIGVGSAAVAMVVAVVLSPLTPIGVARRAELHPGVATDGPVLATGGMAVVALVVVSAALAAWRAARTDGDLLGMINPTARARPSQFAAVLAAAGASPATVIGVRLALEPGRGRTAVAQRTALAGAVAAVCAVIAMAGFGASLTHLTQSPEAYGVTWDVIVRNLASAEAVEPLVGRLQHHSDVAAVATHFGQISISIDGHDLPVMAIQNRQGSVPPAVIEGHEPRRSDEIALGSISLSSLNKQVGDTVTVATNHKPTQRLRVVGRAVLNQPGYDLTGAIAPGKGGLVHPDVLRRLAPDPAFAYPGALLVRIHPAVDREQALARLQGDFPGMISTPRPHADIRNLQRIAHLPALLAALVALVGLGTVTHALISCTRTRRSDLAILKTLGFLRGQVTATIAWQASTFAVIALGLGLPLGLTVGRWVWYLAAAQIGVSAAPVIPTLPLVATATGTVVAANLVATAPAWTASRLQPALAMRSE